jgi:hypothetical protein
MRRSLLEVLAACGWATPAVAQPFFPGPPGWRGGFAYHPVFGYGFPGKPFVRVVWVAPLPAVVVIPPSVVVIPPPLVVVVGGAVPAGPEPLRQARDDELPRGAKPGDFVVIRPGGRAVAGGRVVPELDKIVKPQPLEPPAPDPFAARPAPAVEKPEADPAAEAARQVRLAKAAFAAEEYAAAADHLTRATRVKPDDPLPHFLLAQVRFTSGRYTDAVAAIEAGLKLAPNWPANDFRPRELYGPHPERFDAHLAVLRKAAAANPDDAGLAFLLGYQLWFNGDQPAAVEQFRKAAGKGQAPAVVAAFLRAAAARDTTR